MNLPDRRTLILQEFFYNLILNHLPAGVVENLIMGCAEQCLTTDFSRRSRNPALMQYAYDLVELLELD